MLGWNWKMKREEGNRKMIEVIQKYAEMLSILILRPLIRFDDTLDNNLPTDGGVYLIVEISHNLKEGIYVDKTWNLKEGICTDLLVNDSKALMFKKKLIENSGFESEKIGQYLEERCRLQYLEVSDERDRTLFAHFAISILNPRFND